MRLALLHLLALEEPQTYDETATTVEIGIETAEADTIAARATAVADLGIELAAADLLSFGELQRVSVGIALRESDTFSFSETATAACGILVLETDHPLLKELNLLVQPAVECQGDAILFELVAEELGIFVAAAGVRYFPRRVLTVIRCRQALKPQVKARFIQRRPALREQGLHNNEP